MVKTLTNREKYVHRVKPFMDKPIIKVFVGQRRVGKSYLLKLIREMLLEKPGSHVIYIDKEDEAYSFINTSSELTAFINSHKNDQPGITNYVFIDEVQEIESFENSIRSFAGKDNFDIYISGSNSEILSGELSTRLSGRYIEIPVFSLDFSEFCNFHGLDTGQESLDLYLKFGGMPFLKHLELSEAQAFEYLRSVTTTILYKDVITRYSIRNVNFLDRLVHFLSDNVGSIVNAKRISDYLKSQKTFISVNTVLDYLQFLTASQIVLPVKRQDIKGRKTFEVGEKYYFQDWGIRNALIGHRVSDTSKLLENCVFHHLRSHQYQVFTGDRQEREIDFIAVRNNEKVYIQVAWLLTEPSTIDREFVGNLLEIKDNYRKIVVSMDNTAPNTTEGVEHRHLLDFLKEFR